MEEGTGQDIGVASSIHWDDDAGNSALRRKIVSYAVWGTTAEVQPRIKFSEIRPIQGINRPKQLPLPADCVGYATLCYNWAEAPDPNGRNYDGHPWIGYILRHMRHIPLAQAKNGDLVVWDFPGGSSGAHVAIIVEGGSDDPLLVSHGQGLPRQIRFSAANRYHLRAGHTQITGLTLL